ncbi:dehydrogenase [Tersicoccus solisilvae]|uniref:Dehydrogenase n=2 Tax=Tersicoccus solisilvae TaxID=1882339 RepID=A0ABQ1P4V2_9MICC|nr:dehydrogenase [Tersicoccus solisilvae]
MPDVELTAVVDVDARRARAVADAWPHGRPAVVTDLARLFDGPDPAPDVVHITTPHADHVPLALTALAAGVDVLLEKPLASTLADGERLAAAADASTARLGICFQNRYNATSRAMRAVLDAGDLGEVIGAGATVRWHRDAAYYASRPWRGTWAGSGGGVLMNQAIHTLDLLLWLLGDAEEVTGSAGQRALGGVIEVEDTADLNLRHAGGVRSTLFATNAASLNHPVSLEVQGTRGRMVLNGDLTVLPDDGDPVTVTETLPGDVGRSYWGASHAALIRDFHAGHGSGEPFWIDAAEALKPLRAITAVYAQTYPAGAWV